MLQDENICRDLQEIFFMLQESSVWGLGPNSRKNQVKQVAGVGRTWNFQRY